MQSLKVGTMAVTVPSMELSSLTRHHSESCTWTNSLNGNRPMSIVYRRFTCGETEAWTQVQSPTSHHPVTKRKAQDSKPTL